ncbi:putative pyridoxal kinase [Cryptotrichosporon argae]
MAAPAAPAAPGRILSVQSHVVSGYVGNRAATFPLQMLGYDVDVINTVQFSNHTGYGHTDGHKTAPEQLAAVFSGLRTNGLVDYDRVLSGYIPGAHALGVVRDEVERMARERDVVYLLDPVMGDIGVGLYVSQDVVPIYRDMLRLATIITPNQFEVELLSEKKITSLPSLHAALLELHTQVPNVVLSSLVLPTALLASLGAAPPPAPPVYTALLPAASPAWYDPALSGADTLVCLASARTPDGACETWLYALPTVRGYFSGVGDLFSALVLGHYDAPAGLPCPSSAASASASSWQTETSTPAITIADTTAPASADPSPIPPPPPPVASAVARALLTVQQILVRTHLATLDAAAASSGVATPRPLREGERPPPGSVIPSDAELDAADPAHGETRRKARRMRLRELRIVQERGLIEAGGEWPGVRLDWDAILASEAE